MIDTLVLFFTRGVSVRTWLQRGIFDREKRIYEEHLCRGHVRNVLWLTYGVDDADVTRQLHAEGRLHPGIQAVGMPHVYDSRLGKYLYSLVMPLLNRKALQRGAIFKTNQMDGAWAALVARALFGKPIIVRTGFTLSLLEAHEHGESALRFRLARALEYLAYRCCDMALVTSRVGLAYIFEKYHPRDIRLLPNYVDTNLFYPGAEPRVGNRLVFVGRLHPQKNLRALIPVLRDAGYGLDVYGSGHEEAALRELAAACGADVLFHGSIANDKLPDVLRKAEVFILPSPFEGMPKALLEAMACGCVCVGADVPGVNEVIRDGKNGLLAPSPTEAGFRVVLQRLKSADRQELSKAGVACITAEYSLSAVAASEGVMFDALLAATVRTRATKDV